MFKSLSEKIQDSLQKLRGEKQISETNIRSALNDLRRALLEADVSLSATKTFITKVESQALGQEVLRGLKPYEQFIKIVQDSLTDLLSSKEAQPNYEQILLLGLQGAGKTSTAAKLAYKFKNRNPLLVPCDLQRPAAIEQLRVLAKQAGIAFAEPAAAGIDPNTISDAHVTNKSAYLYKLVDYALEQASTNKYQCLIFDTAGRLSANKSVATAIGLDQGICERGAGVDLNVNEDAERTNNAEISQSSKPLMQELKELEQYIRKRSGKNLSNILVLDSLIGQEAAKVAASFNTNLNIDGVILTKLDGDSRGGAALSIVEACNKPILLATCGEKLEDLEEFHPERMASRILGMGDIVSLVEKAQQRIETEEARKIEEQLLKGNFNYEVFIAAQNMMSKLGNMGQMLEMLGMGSMLKQFGINAAKQETLMAESQDKMRNFKTAISSMTKEERRKPDLLSKHPSARSRKARIAKGSGLKETDIDKLTSEFTKMRELFANMGPMMQMMKSGNPMAKLNPLANMASMRGMPQLAKSRPATPQTKKGEKPKVKGFKN